MNRRAFLIQSSACLVAASAPQLALAQAVRFRPTRFTVQVRGTGPDVILIPGLTSSRDVWSRAVAAVPGYRYHLIQVSGFAGEPARGNANGPVVAPLAEEIARYIASERLQRPALIGHSMGGTVGMMLTARRPDLVGKLMVVDMLPRPTAMYGGTRAGELAQALGQVAANPLGRQFLSAIVSAFTPAEDAGRGSDPDVVARAMRDLGTTDLTADLARMRRPLTVVYAVSGEEARGPVARAFEQAYRGARGARLLPVLQSGHLVMADQPQRFAAALRDFLR